MSFNMGQLDCTIFSKIKLALEKNITWPYDVFMNTMMLFALKWKKKFIDTLEEQTKYPWLAKHHVESFKLSAHSFTTH